MAREWNEDDGDHQSFYARRDAYGAGRDLHIHPPKTQDPIPAEDLLKRLHGTLREAEAWSRGLSGISGFSVAAVTGAADPGAIFGLLRTQASTLINIAVHGAFSSGKSFLVSDLQGLLEMKEVPRDHGGHDEQFVGLVPSSPVPVNACPVHIVPVDGDTDFDCSGKGYMRVRFAGSPDWVNVGHNLPPETVAAYVAADGNLEDRPPAHRSRIVTQAEILISNYKIRAVLHDLPGVGSPMKEHNKIVSAAWEEADCFIYATRAIRSLSAEDLGDIESLYEHCAGSRKPVIWVLTGIDQAANLDRRQDPGWLSVRKLNNDYLAEHFQRGRQPDLAFIGNGFIAVSPADEARAVAQAGKGDSKEALRLQTDSQMDSLHRKIQELIDDESGPRHVAKTAFRAVAELRQLVSAVSNRLTVESVPLVEQARLLADTEERLRRAESAISRLQEHLEPALIMRARRVKRSFAGLADHLHAELDALIRDTEIRDAGNANRINVTQSQLLQAWTEGQGRPRRAWDENMNQFRQDVARWLEERLGNDDMAAQMTGVQFDMEGLEFDMSHAPRTAATAQTIQRVAMAAGVTAPLTAILIQIGNVTSWASLSAGFVFGPAAAIAGFAALTYLGVKHYKANARRPLAAAQQERIANLDHDATAAEEQYYASFIGQGVAIIDSVAANLRSHRMLLSSTIELLKERMADDHQIIVDPEFRMKQRLVEQLEEAREKGEGLMAEFNELLRVRPSGPR